MCDYHGGSTTPNPSLIWSKSGDLHITHSAASVSQSSKSTNRSQALPELVAPVTIELQNLKAHARPLSSSLLLILLDSLALLPGAALDYALCVHVRALSVLLSLLELALELAAIRPAHDNKEERERC